MNPSGRKGASPAAAADPLARAKPASANMPPSRPATAPPGPPQRATFPARLDGKSVVVDDTAHAKRLHNRHWVGTPEGDTLRLSLAEAAWCVAGGRVDIGPHPATGQAYALADLLAHAATTGRREEVTYLVYADLRERGLVVRHAGRELAVYPRGASQGGEPAYHVVPSSERDPVAVATLHAAAERSAILAVVDEDGGVTHYAATVEDPRGQRPPVAHKPTPASLLADRVLVTDPEAAKELWASESVGSPHGAFLVLSLVEAEALRERGVLQLPSVAARARDLQPDFDAVLQAYKALRAAGVVAKTGFKFGTHLRGYRADPDSGHAEWLVQACAPGATATWGDLSRGIRLAHGVRKRFLLATGTGPGPADAPMAFTQLAWFRP